MILNLILYFIIPFWRLHWEINITKNIAIEPFDL